MHDSPFRVLHKYKGAQTYHQDAVFSKSSRFGLALRFFGYAAAETLFRTDLLVGTVVAESTLLETALLGPACIDCICVAIRLCEGVLVVADEQTASNQKGLRVYYSVGALPTSRTVGSEYTTLIVNLL